MFTEQLKTNGTAIKILRGTTNNQQKNYNSVKHVQRQQFLIHDDKYLSVSKNPESSSLKLKVMF